MPTFRSGVQAGLVARLDATLIETDVVNNRSKVRLTGLLESPGNVWLGSSRIASSLWIDGANVAAWAEHRTLSAGGTVAVIDAYFWIGHHSDGTKTTNVSVNIVDETNRDFNQWAGGNWTLTTIPRATTPNWSGNFETNAAKTINLPRAASGFTHDVTYTFGSTAGTIATGVGVTTSWTPPLSLLTQIPDAASGTGTITVVTKNGATVIGSKNVNFTLNADATVTPIVNTVLWDDDNTTVKANIGAFVQGLSLIKGAVTAEGKYDSTVVEKRLRIGTTIVPEGTPIQVAGSGTVSAQGEAVDSRGRLGVKLAPFTVLPYVPPTLGSSGWQIRRATSNGSPSDTGTYLRLDLHAVVQSLIVGSVQKNAMTIRVRTRPVGGAWTNRNVITPGLTYNTNVLISGGSAFSVAQSFEVEVTVEDKTGIEPTRLGTTIPTAAVTLDLNGNQVGVGKYWEKGALDVGGDIYMNGEKVSVVSHTHVEYSPIGSMTAFAGSTAPTGWLLCQGQAVSRTTYAALYATLGDTFGSGNGSTTFNVPDMRGRVPVGVSSTDAEFNALGGTFGTKTHTLTQAEMPVHTHGVPGGTAFVANGSGGTSAGVSTGGGGYQLRAPANAGSGGAHNNIQPSIALNYIIRAI